MPRRGSTGTYHREAYLDETILRLPTLQTAARRLHGVGHCCDFTPDNEAGEK